MARITNKTALTTVDGTPKKRVFLSIISDYDLTTGICELVDNALDVWTTNDRKSNLHISIVLDADRQLIRVRDNAGGVSEADAELLIAPGASRNDAGEALIGIFGVGGKRAGVALGELVEIRTRHGQGKSLAIDLTREWIESDDWQLEIFEIPDIEPETTIVEISKVRKSFARDDVDAIRTHLAETYSWFIAKGCSIELNGTPVEPITFDAWAYPPAYLPRRAEFTITPVPGKDLNVRLTAGLILDRDPEQDNYGVYFYCNHRLIVKEVKTRDVGYFVSAEAGVPHPDASLCRLLVHFDGPAELMPWNSSKSAVNFSDPAFIQIRPRVIELTSYYTGLSRRLKLHWEDSVFRHTTGRMELIDTAAVLSTRKKILPKLPRSRSPSYIQVLKENNRKRIKDQPWILGLVETMGLLDLLKRQRAYTTRNRIALILLDSNFEIALKEFIVHRPDLFPPHKYTDKDLAELFKRRTNVIKAIQPHAKFPKKLLQKIQHYYGIRNVLVHERASVSISDEQVQDYREIVERVIAKLFGVVFSADIR